MLKKVIILFCFLSSLFACSSNVKNKHKNHNLYLEKMEISSKRLSAKEYKTLLEKELNRKQSHLKELQLLYQREGEAQLVHESAGASTSDIQHMSVRSSQIKLHDMAEDMKILEKEIFFLKTKLSAINTQGE